MERLDKNQYGHLSQKIFEKTQTAVGTADISHIADGTLTGALGAMGSRLDPNIVKPVVPAYAIDGADVFTAAWLSLEDGGEALTPIEGNVYEILNGEYKDKLVYYNGTVYRLIGNRNVKDEFVSVPLGTQNVPMSSSVSTYYYNETNWGTSVTVTENMRRIDLACTGSRTTGGTAYNAGHFRVYWKGNVIMTDASPWSWSVDLTPSDVGSVLQFQTSAGTSTSAQSRASISGTAVVQYHYRDFETEDYIPPTDLDAGQSGLVPSAPAGTQSQVFTSSGWNDLPLDITAEEIETIFNNATGTTTTYNGTEFIIGEFGGKTLYESRLPLSGVSGNNLSSFEFTAHKMIDGRVSLPTRLIDLSINRSGDQWAVSPVVSLSADEKQNGTLIIEYTKE